VVGFMLWLLYFEGESSNAHWTEDWMVLRDDLDIVVKENVSLMPDMKNSFPTCSKSPQGVCYPGLCTSIQKSYWQPCLLFQLKNRFLKPNATFGLISDNILQ